MDKGPYKTNTQVCSLVDVGMYDTPLSPGEMFDWEFQDEENPREDSDWDKFDYAAYKRKVGQEAARIAEENAKEYLVGEKYGIAAVTSDGGIDSPRPYEGYNFRSDYLNIDIEVRGDFKETAIINLMSWKGGEIEKYVKEAFTSRDGFTSHVPNTLEGIVVKIMEEDDIDRIVGLYADLCLRDAGYYNEGIYGEQSPASQATMDLCERIGCNTSFGDFMLEDEE
jgi:hypothetical protein